MKFISSDEKHQQYTVDIAPEEAGRILTDGDTMASIATRAGDEVVHASSETVDGVTKISAAAYLGPAVPLPGFIRKLFKGSLLLSYDMTWSPTDDGSRIDYLVHIGRKKESYVEGTAFMTETDSGGTHVSDTFTAYVGENKLFKKKLLSFICRQARVMIPTVMEFAQDIAATDRQAA